MYVNDQGCRNVQRGEKMKGIKIRVLSGIATVWFISVIRTNATPQMWQIALVGIMLYEVNILFMQTYQNAKKNRAVKKIQQTNNRINKRNARNLNEFRIGWPMQEISE